QRFQAEDSPVTRARVIDELLANPRYGERWGRHWLDVARYADTKDLVLLYGRDALRPFAYTYRDYVIRAFNEDLPFPEFVQDQLAADLVRPAVPPWRLAAMGFLTLGRLFDQNPHDQIDDQIDTVTRGLLGLTVACARCHDHKYDAISMADYYGLYGVFASTERPLAPPLLEDPAQVPGGEAFEQSLAKARKELEDHVDAEFAKLTEVMRQRLGDYLVRAATTAPDLAETTQFFLSLTPDDYRPQLMLRTRRFLQQRVRPEDRLFGPWAVLVPGDTDTPRLAELERPPAAAGGGRGWNPLVVAALRQAAPTNRAGVARAYGDLFRSVYDLSKATKTNGTVLGPDPQEVLEVVVGTGGPVWFARRDTPNHLSRPEKDRYGGLVLNLDKIAAHATHRPPARAMVVADLPEPVEPRIFVRGSPSRPGETVPRSFLRVLHGGQPRPLGEGSGRLELARAIASPTNPLVARVFVNRVWMHHFGEPLAGSTTDFGARSEPPSHPELLDWLAGEFIRSGWSVKALHRRIVLSAAYRQAGPPATAGVAARLDPENRLLWHYPRRRLDLEAMRDTLLWISGRLDPALGGPPEDVAGDPLNGRRTVYGLVDRQNLPGLFRSFDFAPPDQCAERRPRTTVPQQALFALNSPFVREQALALVRRPEIAGEADPDRRVAALFRRVLGRPPNPRETGAIRRFLAAGDDPGTAAGEPWVQLAQALLIGNEATFID
ncbi:MAG: DUF1549 and DUF1553 domain-containing protein, partial [Verrucomicrobiota bacterium]